MATRFQIKSLQQIKKILKIPTVHQMLVNQLTIAEEDHQSVSLEARVMEKRQRRMIKNRESAARSRARKQVTKSCP